MLKAINTLSFCWFSRAFMRCSFVTKACKVFAVSAGVISGFVTPVTPVTPAAPVAHDIPVTSAAPVSPVIPAAPVDPSTLVISIFLEIPCLEVLCFYFFPEVAGGSSKEEEPGQEAAEINLLRQKATLHSCIGC